MKKEFREAAMEREVARSVEGAAMPDVIAEMQRERYAGFVGLDIHKETIAVALALPGPGEPKYLGEFKNSPKAVAKLVQRLSADGELFLFCYEAGPCGYGLYRQIIEMGHDCEVVAPPKSEQIKTDRRDALRLSRLLRAGELRAVWVPDAEQEAMRDLSRCRGDFRAQEHKARQQLKAFVLRHGHHWLRGRNRSVINGLQRLTGVTAFAAVIYLRHPALALLLGAALAIAFDAEPLPRSERFGKHLLQSAIVLLGFALPLGQVWGISRDFGGLVSGYVILTLLAGFGLGVLLRAGRNRTALLAGGTAICGGTTIAALAPVLRAPARDIVVCMGAVFLLNAVAIVILPWLGHRAQMSQQQFGVWAALAIHDTGSVIGAAAVYGDRALTTATTVKLLRTLWLIPLIVAAAIIVRRGERASVRVPVFVLLFVAASGLATLLRLHGEPVQLIKLVSQYILVAALFCIGSQISRRILRELNARAVVFAVSLWMLVLGATFFAARYYA